MSSPSTNRAAAYPTWLPMPACAVHVVAGPPGPGLRAFAEQQLAGVGSGQIIDIGEIIATLSQGRPGNWAPLATEQRNIRLESLGAAPADHQAWLIQPSPKQWMRDFWAVKLNARVHLIDPGKPAALAAAEATGLNVRYVHQWYDEFADPAGHLMPPVRDTRERHLNGAPAGKPAPGKYGNKQGQMRAVQLLKQPWCERCLAEGRGQVQARHMNHIKPFMLPDGSFDGKLFGDPKNHQSLCATCHNAHGAKTNRDETPLGSGVDGRPLDPNHPWNRK